MKHAVIFLLILLSSFYAYSDSWEEITPGESPDARYGHSMVEINSVVYIFGGIGDSSEYFDDLWKFVPNSHDYEEITPDNDGPDARYGHSAVVYNGKMYIFFGKGDGVLFDDVWSYDPDTKKWEEQTRSYATPDPRYYQRMVVIDDEAWLFGGRNDVRAIVDSVLWKYNFSDNQWETVPTSRAPEGRYGHSLIAISDKFYMYGGKKDNDNVYQDLWEFDTNGEEWNELSSSASPGRRYHHITVTNGTDKLWIAGGLYVDGTESESDELWEYDINDEKWVQKDDGPTIIKAAAILEESRANDIELFIFGGEKDSDIKGSTWKYDSTDDQSDDDDDDGSDHSISCGATGMEFFIFLSMLFLIKVYRLNKN